MGSATGLVLSAGTKGVSLSVITARVHPHRFLVTIAVFRYALCYLRIDLIILNHSATITLTTTTPTITTTTVLNIRPPSSDGSAHRLLSESW